MSLFSLVILSLVEGATEFLPVSSTGHLIITSQLLGLPQTDFLKSFEIFIQMGSILAVVILYWHQAQKIRANLTPLFWAFLPTVVIGFTLYKFFKNYLLGNYLITLNALFWGGLLMIAIELWLKTKNSLPQTTSITKTQAFFIGLSQTLSIIPGVSRSASSILGARLLRLDRTRAVEFSFFLAIPTLIAATALDLVKSEFNFSPLEWAYLTTGLLLSFISALIFIKLFLKFIKDHSLIWFGFYRIIIAGIFYLFVN